MVNDHAAVAPARENVATAGLNGSGLKSIGQGVQQLGSAVGNYLETQNKKESDLDLARANSAWLTQKADIDHSRDDEDDQDTLRNEYPKKYQTALDGAAGLIRDDTARQKFILSNQIHVKTGEIASKDAADELQKDAFLAGAGQQLIDLRNAGLKVKDDATRASIVKAGGDLIDQMAENGHITQADAVARKNAWSTNFAESAISMLPPTQRLQALSPVNVGAATKQAMQYFTSQGWTPEQAAGIVGNLIHESGGKLNTNARAAGDGADGSDSIGIGQWNSGRAESLRAFAASKGKDWRDYQTQLEFVQHELTTSESGAAQALKNAKDVRGATEAMLQYERPKGYEGGLANAHGGANRLHQAQGVYANLNGTSSAQPSKLAELLPPDRRAAMTTATENEITGDLRANAAQQRQEAAAVKSTIGDDTSSIMSTGKPVDALTPEKVGKALGPQAQAEFVDNRVRAINYYNATHDFSTLPAEQMPARLESLKPKPGQEGFDAQNKYYQAAQKQADQIVKERMTDPAGAVDRLPQVQAVKQGVNFDKPETIVPLAKARLAAQEAIGIPEGRRIPITKDEAVKIMAPVVNGLAGTERQYLQKIVPMFQQAYGGYADRALQFALEQAKVDADSAKIATSIFKKIGLGERVTQTDQEALNKARTNDAMAKAAGSPPNEYEDMGRAYGAMMSQPQQPAGSAKPDATGTQSSNVRPPSEAIKALIQNPSRADEFDALFGKGMAKRVMNEHQTMTKGATPNG